jgi:hypothetical protein
MSTVSQNSDETGKIDSGDHPLTHQQEIASAVQSPERGCKSCPNSTSKYDQEILKWTKRAGIGVLLYTILTAGILAISHYRFQTAQDQLTLQFPPKVIVKNVAIWPSGEAIRQPVNFESMCEDKRCEIEGEAWLVNLGRESISIMPEHQCMTCWGTDTLPMVPPYYGLRADDPRSCSYFMKFPNFTERALNLESFRFCLNRGIPKSAAF